MFIYGTGLRSLTSATGSFGLMQMFFGIGTVGMSFWLPTIVSGFGLTGTSVSASTSHVLRSPPLLTLSEGTLLLIPPAVLYIITSVCFGYYLDRQTAVPKPAFMLGAVVVMIGEWAFRLELT